MKQAFGTDFKIECDDFTVTAIFQPTESSYSFNMLDEGEWAKHGKLSKTPSVHHAGSSGDTGEYSAAEVADMAYRLAEASVA